MEKSRSVKLNIISMFIYQGVGILSGFIMPRLILATFGSEVNGLTSSLSQFLSYITLFEGGVSTVFTSCLYAPLQADDKQKVSAIIKSSNLFFNKLGLMFLLYTSAVAVVYPIAVNTNFSTEYISTLTFILALATYAQYMFCISYRILLVADNKGFIVYSLQAVCYLGSLILSIVSIKIYPSIHLVKLVGSFFFLIQPIIFSRVAKKKYGLNLHINPDEEVSSQKWSGFGQNFATFIYQNTDIVVLTMFSTLTNVSIYSIYYMILNAVRAFVKSTVTALVPSIGNTYVSSDIEVSNKVYDNLEYIVFISTAFVFSCCAALMMPFVSVYTNGIKDADYSQPIFGFLLMTAFAVECIREPYLQLTFIAGKFRETSTYAYVEAAINVGISIIVVSKYGLVGVAIGTLFAVVFRSIALAFYNQKNILCRPALKWFSNIVLLAGIILLIGVAFSRINVISVTNYATWFKYALIVAVSAAIVIVGVSLVFFKEQMKAILKLIRSRR